jgi:hypothetical protein
MFQYRRNDSCKKVKLNLERDNRKEVMMNSESEHLNDLEAGTLTEMMIFFKHLDSLNQNSISFCLEKRNGN